MTIAVREPLRTALPAMLGLTLAACGPVGGPRSGSQTNWLRTCRADADCGDLQCLCGACTRACAADTTCRGLGGASCVPAADAGAVALCDGQSPSSGLCLPRCTSGECGGGATCVAGVCDPAPEPTIRVAVDASARRQSLVGFGASLTYVNDEIVRHPRKEALFDSMFAELGVDVLRLRNRHGLSGEEDLTSTREIVDAAVQRLGRRPMLLLTSWSPPASLKASGSTVCEGNLDSCTLSKLADGSFDYAGFASHWRASLDAYASVGITADYIGIQNNPNWVPPASDPNEACRFLPTEGTQTVTVDGAPVEVEYPGFAEALSAVIAQLDGLASVPRVAAPEVSGVEFVAEYAPALDFSMVDAIAHHMYGTDAAALNLDALEALGALGEEYQRPIFQTEMAADGFETAVLMHHALTVMGASVYLQNDFVSSAAALERNTMALVSLQADDFVFELPYHVVRHYALHTDPGWARVDATAGADDLLVSAWLSPDERALTVLLLNTGVAAYDTQIELGGEIPVGSEVMRTVFEGVERSAELGSLSAEGVLRIPGRALVTVALRQ